MDEFILDELNKLPDKYLLHICLRFGISIRIYNYYKTGQDKGQERLTRNIIFRQNCLELLKEFLSHRTTRHITYHKPCPNNGQIFIHYENYRSKKLRNVININAQQKYKRNVIFDDTAFYIADQAWTNNTPLDINSFIDQYFTFKPVESIKKKQDHDNHERSCMLLIKHIQEFIQYNRTPQYTST